MPAAIPNSVVVGIFLRARGFDATANEVANACALAIFVGIPGNAGRDGRVVAFADYAGSDLEAGCGRFVARVASDCCTGGERRISFSDFVHNWAAVASVGQSSSTRISVSALRTIKRGIAAGALELSVFSGTFSPTADAGVGLVCGLCLVPFRLRRLCVGAARARLTSRKYGHRSQ